MTEIMVYGASGRLGQMVSSALRTRGQSLCLAGRHEGRLRDVAQAQDRLHLLPGELPSQTSVVVNCAPLNLEQTRDLARDCLSAGAHLVDANGDQSVIFELLEQFDAPAREAGLCIVPSLGFDYAVGDCLARLASSQATAWQKVVVAYALQGSEAGQNSVTFATQGPRGPERVYRRGEWLDVPWELDWGFFDFPAPVGRRQVGRYGAGEVVTVPRHTRTENIYTVITASSLVPHPALLPIFPVLRPLVRVLLRTPVRHLIGWLSRLLSGRQPRQPATQEPTAAGPGPSFVVVAEASTGELLARCTARGGDCHLTTAQALALGADWLAQGKALDSGALAPALAFEPSEFLDALSPGLTWTRG